MSELKKASRASEERSKDKRDQPWAPPSSLDAPAPPQGYCHRWIRVQSMGFEDAGNVSKKLREGWAFLRAETLIGVSGLVLARIPEEIVKSRTEYFKRISADQMDAVDSNLMKEQQPGMKINIDRQSRVTFGGGQKSK